MQVRSPLSNSTNVMLEKEIQCGFIIEHYKKQMGIDVSKYFQGLDSIQIYKCLDAGFRFYYPFNLEGDGEFYEELQKFPWYYMDWKWEHEIASTMVTPMDKVLEIGCARGSFLERMQQKGIECVGLELNESAVETGRRKGLNILSQSMQDHAKQNPGKYDLVCSFQVVEHIASVKEFTQAAVDTLRLGGTLIISVPNNDSLIFKCHDNIVLNMPPHHMGLWDINSLISIQDIFGLKLKRVELEPLYSHRRFVETFLQRELSAGLYRKYGVVGKMLTKVSESIGRRIISYTVSKLSHYMIGHTILVQYTKA